MIVGGPSGYGPDGLAEAPNAIDLTNASEKFCALFPGHDTSIAAKFAGSQPIINPGRFDKDLPF